MTPSGSGSAGALAGYPVIFGVERPYRFRRLHVLYRLLIVLLFSLLVAFAWFIALVYVALPVLAAGFASRDGERFSEEGAVRLARGLHWLVAFDAYLTLLTDEFPLEDPGGAVRYDVHFSGSPTTGSALLRLLYSVPSSLALAGLGVAATVTGIAAGAIVLVREDYPGVLYRFHLAVVRWGGRLLAYHASLVDRYPPFELDTAGAPS